MDRTKALSILDIHDDVDLNSVEQIIAAKISENEMRTARATNAILKEKYESVGRDLKQAADLLRLEKARNGCGGTIHSLPVAARYIDKSLQGPEENAGEIRQDDTAKSQRGSISVPPSPNRMRLYTIGAVIGVVMLLGVFVGFREPIARVFNEYRPATAKEEQQWQEQVLDIFTKSKSKYTNLLKIKEEASRDAERQELALQHMRSAMRSTPVELLAAEKELKLQKKYSSLLEEVVFGQELVLQWEGELAVVRQLQSDKKFKDALAKVEQLYSAIDAADKNILSLEKFTSQQLALDELANTASTRFAGKISQTSHHESLTSQQALADTLLVQGKIHQLSQEVYPDLIALYQKAIGELEHQKSSEKQQLRQSYIANLQKQFVNIPAGSFKMGVVKAGATDARPIHEVHVDGFQLSKYPVTVEDYNQYLKFNNKPLLLGQKLKNPVTEISWNDALEFAKWLSATSGASFRLATEAEWEYAARTGISTDFPWGNSPGRNKANCADCGSQWDNASPSPVGSFPANQWGLHDMNGNVWEWVQDCYVSQYSPQHNTASAVEFVGCEKRVVRGGCWSTPGKKLHPAFRAAGSPTFKNNTVGFRLVLDGSP